MAGWLASAPPANFYLQAAAELHRRRLARKSLHEFVRQGWAEVEAAPFVDNWHIGAVCEHLQAVSAGQIPKLLINLPPGMGKSLSTCVFGPAWEWAHEPTVRWLFASYDQRLTIRDAVRCRTLLHRPWYTPARWNSGPLFSTTLQYGWLWEGTPSGYAGATLD